MANVPACNIAPLAVGVLVEGLKYANILFHFGQLFLLSLHGHLILSCLLQVLTLRLHLQPSNLPNQEVSVSSVVTDTGLDLFKATLELTESSKSDMLGRCASALEVVINSCVPSENVTVADTKDLGTRGTVFVLVLMEEHRDTTLSISHLPLCSGDRHAQSSSKEAADIVGGVDVVGDA